MEDLIQLIGFIIFGVAVLLSRAARKKKLPNGETPDQSSSGPLPPWIEELMQIGAEEIETEPISETPPAEIPAPEPQILTTPEPTPPRSETPTKSQPKPKMIAGIPINAKSFRQAIILSEILKPPKSLR